ncbi:MAG: DUF4190 domain-containing protein [Bacteroidia bacterium]|nr:DUF4190 domain-containing protein [Bacteroidia bacterium]
MQRLLLILPFLILFSCSVQKRKYQKGFYVSNTKHSKQVQKKDKVKKDLATESLVLKQTAITVTENEALNISASANTTPLLLLQSPFIKKLRAADSLCDQIMLKNGEEVSAKILEITPTEVKYQKCGVTDGPLYIVKKSDVFMIKYVNGTKEVFKVEGTEPTSNSNNNGTNKPKDKYTGPKKMHPLAVLAFISAIFGIYPLTGLASIGAIIFANIALKEIKQKPNQYKGEMLAKVARVLGYIMLVLLVIVMIAVFAFLLGM